MGELRGHGGGVLRGVVVGHADEGEQPGIDGADGVASHAHRGAPDPLDNDSHDPSDDAAPNLPRRDAAPALVA